MHVQIGFCLTNQLMAHITTLEIAPTHVETWDDDHMITTRE